VQSYWNTNKNLRFKPNNKLRNISQGNLGVVQCVMVLLDDDSETFYFNSSIIEIDNQLNN